MNYGIRYKQVSFSKNSLQIVSNALKVSNNFEEAILDRQGISEKRKSKVSWINNSDLYTLLLKMVNSVNESSGWNFNITGVEPVQYGIYEPGGKYDWHVDQYANPINKNVRKISMSLFLNDDYKGGEFDLELYSPSEKRRYETFKLSAGSALFFHGDQWHRVRPVTSGVRKSLVAWFYGPEFK
jgi:PKHD-type hydroxylase